MKKDDEKNNIYAFQSKATFSRSSQDQTKMAKQPMFHLPSILLWFVGSLFLIHLLRLFLPVAMENNLIISMAFNPLRYGDMAGLFPENILPPIFFKVATFVTYSLLHNGWMHIVFNSLWLIIFGAPVAWRFGNMRFIMLCMMTAFGGAFAHLIFHFGANIPMIGASAITSGAMAATMCFAFTGSIHYIPQSDPRRYRLPAPSFKDAFTTPLVAVLFGVWLVFNLMHFLLPSFGGGNIAWQAHIGGFCAGIISFYLLDPIRKLAR